MTYEEYEQSVWEHYWKLQKLKKGVDSAVVGINTLAEEDPIERALTKVYSLRIALLEYQEFKEDAEEHGWNVRL